MHLQKPTHAQSIRIKAKFHDYVRKKKVFFFTVYVSQVIPFHRGELYKRIGVEIDNRRWKREERMFSQLGDEERP